MLKKIHLYIYFEEITYYFEKKKKNVYILLGMLEWYNDENRLSNKIPLTIINKLVIQVGAIFVLSLEVESTCVIYYCKLGLINVLKKKRKYND